MCVYMQTRARLKYDLNGRDITEGSWGWTDSVQKWQDTTNSGQHGAYVYCVWTSLLAQQCWHYLITPPQVAVYIYISSCSPQTCNSLVPNTWKLLMSPRTWPIIRFTTFVLLSCQHTSCKDSRALSITLNLNLNLCSRVIICEIVISRNTREAPAVINVYNRGVNKCIVPDNSEWYLETTAEPQTSYKVHT